ncbi:MAG: hypothetical protein KatS3mg003_1061 [Candidatus Nitrosocaldaceae archaeon]|nr:MAG: hypothetical protein KatS3mg003_1061 [Candidatus Nitrosocaldaceae archaeon]
MVSINGTTIKVLNLTESKSNAGSQFYEYDSSLGKIILTNKIFSKKYVWELTVEESASTPITNSIAEIIDDAFYNNNDLTFVLDLSYHNRGTYTVRVKSPTVISYSTNQQGLRLISFILEEK